MKIRVATKADMAEMFQLEQGAFGTDCYPDFLFRQLLDLWPNYLLVAENEATLSQLPRGALLGYTLGGVGEAKSQGWVLSLAVTEQARGLGIGKALLQHLIGRLTEEGCQQLRLTVHPDNSAAGLYHALGFEHESSEPDYFGSNEPRQVLLRTV